MGRGGYTVSPYTRYWHGYQIVLKPLLIFLNYQEIRYLNMCLQLGLIMIIIICLMKQKMNMYVTPYLMMVCSTMPLGIALSIQFSGVFYIANLSMLIILLKYEKIKENVCVFFFVIGMVTSFIDLLTYPLITLALPLVIYFCKMKDDKKTFNIIKTILFSFMWGIGYAVMWSGKWLIGSVLLKKNLVKDALLAITSRASTSVNGNKIPIYSVIGRNINTMFESPIKYLFLILISGLVLILLYKTIHYKRNYFNNWHFLLIASMPVVWYVMLANHSYVHFWFTYRECAIFIFAILGWLFRNYEESIEKKQQNNIVLNCKQGGI